MWELYDALIDNIPAHERVTLAVRGRWQAYVESTGGAGLSSLLLPGKIPYADTEEMTSWQGRSLRDAAALSKSEDGVTAALGVAAINAWYNREENLRAAGAVHYSPASTEGDVFDTNRELCRGKVVSTIGHFHGSDRLAELKELRIFEKEPRPGDYPAEREEELLPGSDIVVVTGMALTNHTMEHILTLAQGSILLLAGPSVPVTGVWRSFGVTGLYGTTVWDIPRCRQAALRGGHKDTWPHMGKAVLTF